LIICFWINEKIILEGVKQKQDRTKNKKKDIIVNKL